MKTMGLFQESEAGKGLCSAMPTTMTFCRTLIRSRSMQGGNSSPRSPLWVILLHSGHKTQDSKSSPPPHMDLICDFHWGGWMAMLDREFPIRTCFSVNGFGSLERLKALFVLPKSTKPSTPSSSQWNGLTVKTVCAIAFFFPFPAVKVQSFDFCYHLNKSFFFSLLLLPLLSSGCMLTAPAIAKIEDKNPGAGNAKSMGIFMVDIVEIKGRAWVFVGGITSTITL